MCFIWFIVALSCYYFIFGVQPVPQVYQLALFGAKRKELHLFGMFLNWFFNDFVADWAFVFHIQDINLIFIPVRGLVPAFVRILHNIWPRAGLQDGLLVSVYWYLRRYHKYSAQYVPAHHQFLSIVSFRCPSVPGQIPVRSYRYRYQPYGWAYLISHRLRPAGISSELRLQFRIHFSGFPCVFPIIVF